MYLDAFSCHKVAVRAWKCEVISALLCGFFEPSHASVQMVFRLSNLCCLHCKPRVGVDVWACVCRGPGRTIFATEAISIASLIGVILSTAVSWHSLRCMHILCVTLSQYLVTHHVYLISELNGNMFTSTSDSSHLPIPLESRQHLSL